MPIFYYVMGNFCVDYIAIEWVKWKNHAAAHSREDSLLCVRAPDGTDVSGHCSLAIDKAHLGV